MVKRLYFVLLLFICFLMGQLALAQGNRGQKLDLQHADQLLVILSDDRDTTVAFGSVAFQTETGSIFADSAVWVKGRQVLLIGSVILEDTAYRLIADSVDYNLRNGVAIATGPYVELFSRIDSLFAVGTHAYYDREGRYFRMEKRPTLYLNYPDSAEMIEVIADTFEYDADDSLALATGNVVITSDEVAASAGRAEMNPKGSTLDLYEQPRLQRGKSTVKGRFITIATEDDLLSQILVVDSAEAQFMEPVKGVEPPRDRLALARDTVADSLGVQAFDQSILRGQRIVFDFEYGDLRTITSTGQAFSWYYPSSRGSNELNDNTVSGDTITFRIRNDDLQDVTVVGEAVGTYVNTKTTQVDTTTVVTRDTVDYSSQYIRYNMSDSTIMLVSNAHITSGTVVLDAYQTLFDTERRIIRAFSAEVVSDSLSEDSSLTARFQPNQIPVVLKDKQEELFGDFLEYSIDTKKGRIVQSKSEYETGFYYGERVYREQEDVFYVENGRYTTCDADEPHFHFYSKHMKLVQDDKLFARPVVLNIGRLPVLALPYYVFPLKKGRHSGILPFRIGNIEEGSRYIENLGYYWAPSDYWDAQAGFSYYDVRSAFTLSSEAHYRKLYVLDGYASGNLTKETGYDRGAASEVKRTRWTLQAAHNHEISPGFKLSGTGQYVSDKTYFQDYSADLRDRLNDNITSRLNFSKRFSRMFTLSGAFSHTVYLDEESRIDKLENVGITLPTIKPFGSGSRNAEGQLETKWYHALSIRPTTRYSFLSERLTIDSTWIVRVDTTIDTTAAIPDTTVTSFSDSLSYRSRRKFGSADHAVNLDLPLTMARYIRLNPSFSYSESWVYLFETDRTQREGLEPGGYRSYIYRTGISARTDLYGTVYPNLFGLLGLRQVLTPSIGYSYTPEINRHADVKRFTGIGQGTIRAASAVGFGIDQLYQAKIRSGETDRNLDLLSISTSVSYDFENPTRPWSSMSTRFQSNVLPRISISGDLLHSLYEPGTDEANLLSPYLESFTLNASVQLNGQRFIFDDVVLPAKPEADTLRDPLAPRLSAEQSSVTKGWDMRLAYSYRESGRGDDFVKSSFLTMGLRFNLTPTTTVSYTQYYNISEGKTVNNQINIVKQLHCWTGQLYWVPIGSNSGYGFRLFVTAIPAIKLDNSETGEVAGHLMQSLQR